ncbi:MAG: flagellar basal body P-ring protein FlgI [Phycisphaerales bacterium]|nr:MAG: flagellar basal body P-ring protein FlgI [Phycisphaerales bacterium]
MKRAITTVVSLTLLSFAAPAGGQNPVARVGDVTRLQGQGHNVLLGYGLVAGLDNSGDGYKFLPTMQALASMMGRFGADVQSPDDIGGARNVAIVMVEVVIPEHGAREGDLLDVAVTAVAAKSLEGGRLLPTPLVYHDRDLDGLFGFAQGAIALEGFSRTAGLIRNGARMERDVFINVVATGAELRRGGLGSPWIKAQQTYVTLVLDDAHAGWSMAAAVAHAVDKELSISADVDRVALAMDSKNIVVLLPEHQRGDPASWIRDIEQTPLLMESNEARITVNRNTGTIVITGDTRLSPVVISQRGMTVTVINPLEDGTVPRAPFEQQDFVALDSEQEHLPNVRDLLEALNRLKVPFKDRVAILEEIHRAGKLHAKLLYEG